MSEVIKLRGKNLVHPVFMLDRSNFAVFGYFQMGEKGELGEWRLGGTRVRRETKRGI